MPFIWLDIPVEMVLGFMTALPELLLWRITGGFIDVAVVVAAAVLAVKGSNPPNGSATGAVAVELPAAVAVLLPAKRSIVLKEEDGGGVATTAGVDDDCGSCCCC